MDTIVGLLILFLVFGGWRLLYKLLRATSRSLEGKGSFSDNLEFAFKGMGPLEARITSKTLNPDGSGSAVKEIEIKGIFPPAASTFEEVEIHTSIFDETSGDFAPVLSYIDDFQERSSRVFQYRAPLGRVQADHGFITWVRAGAVILDFVQPPYSGQRKIAVIIRMLDSNAASLIEHGFHKEDPRIFWQRSFRFEYLFKDKGYLEAAEARDKSTALAIKLALVIAMADGTLSDAKGNVLKRWVERAISPYSGERQSAMKKAYNSALAEGYRLAKGHQSSLTSIVTELNKIAEKPSKYEAIELCFDIMTAEEKVAVEPLRVIRLIAEALELDVSEIEKIKDRRIVNLSSSLSGQSSVETLVGIDPNWNTTQIKKHLRDEFQKWNNRLTAVEGPERESAQRMLDAIAEARRKYG